MIYIIDFARTSDVQYSKKLQGYQLLTKLLFPIFLSMLFSLFIYLSYFGYSFWVVEFIVGFAVLWGLFSLDKRGLFIFGFFSSIFWFYWVGLSFRYYDLEAFAIPSVLILSLSLGLLFLLAGFVKNLYLRALFFLFFDTFAPFGFDWMKLELMFVNTPLEASKTAFAIVLLSALLAYKRNPLFLAIFPLLMFTTNFDKVEPIYPKASIELVGTNIDQSIKWDGSYLGEFEEENFKLIANSQKNGFDMTVLPESAFPYYINRDPKIIERLKSASFDKAIVTGALYLEDNTIYNAAYIFKDGNYTVAKKTVLVPFGEYVPLPSPLDRWVNDTFFGGASDFIEASLPTDFEYMGNRYRVAICYEATNTKIYKNSPLYIIAISNNAWFVPSIEPTLQKLLMKFYAKKFNKIIFHAVNGSPSFVITP